MMEEDVSTWVGMESLQDNTEEQNTTEDHVVWVIVPNTGNSVSNEGGGNGASANSSMVISSTTETVFDSHGNKTNIQIAEITHQKKKMGRKNNVSSRFVCDICGLKYSRNFNLRRHKESVHVSTTVQCPYCPSTFTRHDNLTQHIKFIHNNMGSNRCKYCGKQFARKHTMEEHINVQHLNVKKYQCLKCSKLFGYPWSLYNHVRVKHECDGAFKCYYCSKVFSTIKNLRNHVLSIHEGVRYKCKICNKVLKCQSAYKSHLKMFHLPKNNLGVFFCSRCTFKCSTKTELIRHMTTKHKWKEVNVCPVCHKAVKHRMTFDRHLLLHNQTDNDIGNLLQTLTSTANPESVDISKEIARRMSSESGPDFTASLIVSDGNTLTDVQPTSSTTKIPDDDHGDKTVYQCSFCNKVFNTRYLLDKHYERTHSYVCSFCSALFLSYDAIKFHQMKFHQGEMESKFDLMPPSEGHQDINSAKDMQTLDDPENPIWSLEEMAELIEAPIPADDWIVEETVYKDEHSQ